MALFRIILAFTAISAANSLVIPKEKADVLLVGQADGKSFYTSGDEEVLKHGTDFLSAVEFCKESGLNPAIISSLAQNEAIINGVGPYKGFWVPLTDIGEEGQFRWVRNGDLATFEHWVVDSPKGGNNAWFFNCVYMYPATQITGTWVNTACAGSQWRPLCESL